MGLLRLLRRFPRVQLDTPVALAHERRAFIAEATDVSEGGVAVVIHGEAPPEGAVVNLSFRLPTLNVALELNARLVHVMQSPESETMFYVGLQFVRVDENAKKMLRRYINTRRFLFGDLRAPSSSPIVGQRMTERLRRLRHHVALM
jgi:c-di-GMP-binding flagellar brake protein YcgR